MRNSIFTREKISTAGMILGPSIGTGIISGSIASAVERNGPAKEYLAQYPDCYYIDHSHGVECSYNRFATALCQQICKGYSNMVHGEGAKVGTIVAVIVGLILALIALGYFCIKKIRDDREELRALHRPGSSYGSNPS